MSGDKSKSEPTGSHSGSGPFQIRDCAMVALSAGYRAQNLRELRDGLMHVNPDSIYHHFWGRLLQPQFDEPEYMNDFASWIRRGLHEKSLAEQVALVTPTDYHNLEDLRSRLLEIIEVHLDKVEFVPWSRSDQQFYFLKTRMIVLDTRRSVDNPAGLSTAVANMPLGSVFYHFVDSRRRREDHSDDLSAWLEAQPNGKDPQILNMVKQIRRIDPWFSSLKALRFMLVNLLKGLEPGAPTSVGSKGGANA